MPRPALIEFSLTDGQQICLIFQSEVVPLRAEEVHGEEIWVNRCPDDGSLFLEGRPEHYIEKTLCLDPPHDGLMFTLSSDMVQLMGSVKTCSFGDVKNVGERGNGPGFAYDGGSFQHDRTLGISNDSNIVREALSIDAGIVVLIERPDGRSFREYYDEDDPPPANVMEDASSRPSDREDGVVDDVNMEDQLSGQQQMPSVTDDLASSMKILRLRGM